MMTIAPVTFQPVLRPTLLGAPKPVDTLQDLVKARDAADRQAARCDLWMKAGTVVHGAGRAAMVTGVVASGLSLVGVPIPLAPGLGLAAGGFLLRVSGTGMVLQGLAGAEKANVRSIGLSQRIQSLTAAPPPASRWDRTPTVAQAVGSGTLWTTMIAAPAALTAAFGTAGLVAGLAGDILLSSAWKSAAGDRDDRTAMTLAGAFLGGVSGAAGFGGWIGAGIAGAAGLAIGIYNGREVWKGRAEAFS